MIRCWLVILGLALGCADVAPPAGTADNLPLGDLSAADSKADGEWGAALTCKVAPDLPVLPSPRIVLSLHGLTLRLVDETAGFDKVFAIGAGVINPDPTQATFNESLSYYPVVATGQHEFAITPDSIDPCATWWTDPATGERLPVFAGLPFMSWYGSYGIHGPIDNFRAPNGGNLRRGFVSHGCIRMEAADVLEVYARIKGVPRVPVHVQREAERDANGRRRDVPQPWIGSECQSDADCGFTNGFCHANPYVGRGFCSARCTKYCADRPGYPVTFCIDDSDDATRGMCVAKESGVNQGCRPYDHLVPRTLPRRTQPEVSATVCVPGSPGWIGDRCLADADCQDGNRCDGGSCTQACTRFCPDLPGWPMTTCIADATPAGPTCLRQCTPASNASECPAGYRCELRTRVGGSSRSVCVP